VGCPERKNHNNPTKPGGGFPVYGFPLNRKSFTFAIMLVGTGIDAVEIERVARSIERYGARFIQRIFTAGEIAYCQRRKNCAESFAARFAAKEAGAKALGTGIQRGVTWTDMEVRRAPGERPTLHFSGRAQERAERLGVKRVSLALTHSQTLAFASVQLED
jgi:holo-[acyl-carrier protein] synthase